MLDAEPDRRERILYLVRNLAGHLTPGEHTLCSRHFNSTELQIASENARSDAAQPERCQRTKCRCEENEECEIASAPVENEFVATCRSGENKALSGNASRRAISPEHVALRHRLLPARRELSTFGQACLYRRRQQAAARGNHRVESVAASHQHAAGIKK